MNAVVNFDRGRTRVSHERRIWIAVAARAQDHHRAYWTGSSASPSAMVCVALLLGFDFAGMRSLLWRSDMPFAGTLLLCAGFAITFGGLVSAARGDDGFDADGTRQAARRLAPVDRAANSASCPFARRRAAQPLKPSANAD